MLGAGFLLNKRYTSDFTVFSGAVVFLWSATVFHCPALAFAMEQLLDVRPGKHFNLFLRSLDFNHVQLFCIFLKAVFLPLTSITP